MNSSAIDFESQYTESSILGAAIQFLLFASGSIGWQSPSIVFSEFSPHTDATPLANRAVLPQNINVNRKVRGGDLAINGWQPFGSHSMASTD